MKTAAEFLPTEMLCSFKTETIGSPINITFLNSRQTSFAEQGCLERLLNMTYKYRDQTQALLLGNCHKVLCTCQHIVMLKRHLFLLTGTGTTCSCCNGWPFCIWMVWPPAGTECTTMGCPFAPWITWPVWFTWNTCTEPNV